MKKLLLISLVCVCAFAQAQTVRQYELIMRTTGTLVLWNQDTIQTYGFASKLSQNPPVPGPLIIMNEGDLAKVHVRNVSQGPPHTIHWHGLDVDQQNDGTPMTSFELHHMEEATYQFTGKHAGTYIYHCHMGDVVHVQMGMYGLVIVRPADSSNRAWTGGPAYDKTYAWLTSEIDKSWHDSIPDTHHDSAMAEDFLIPKYVPDFFLVNGKSRQLIDKDSATVIRARANEVVYLRLANIGFLKNRFVFPAQLHAKVVDSDGRPLPASFSSDTIEVSPGERYGVMLESPAEMLDSVQVHYVNMNTQQVAATEYVPVTISGYMGVEDIRSKSTFAVVPNPASDQLHILGDASIAAVKIFDISGRMVLSAAPGNTNAPVDIRSLSPGIYVIQLESNTGSGYYKFVKE